MRLVSDFRDWYDAAFSGVGQEYVRNSRSGPGRREQLALLEGAGWCVPPHGLVPEVMGNFWEAEGKCITEVVVYMDENAHCGEGKEVYREDQFRSNPDMGAPGGDRYYKEHAFYDSLYCTAFVGDKYGWAENKGSSLRRLQIGPHVFWVEYRSNESWMSNVGDGEAFVIVAAKDEGHHPYLKYPLFAIDFVMGKEMWAVDLNIAPGTRGIGLERYVSAKEVVEAIEKAVEDRAQEALDHV